MSCVHRFRRKLREERLAWLRQTGWNARDDLFQRCAFFNEVILRAILIYLLNEVWYRELEEIVPERGVWFDQATQNGLDGLDTPHQTAPHCARVVRCHETRR